MQLIGALSFVARILAIGALVAMFLAREAWSQPSQSDIRALRTQLTRYDRRIDSLEVRLAYLRRDSAIIHHAPLDSVSALLSANQARYARELGDVGGFRVSASAVYAGALAGAVALNAGTGWISDPGGYEKRFDQWTVFHVTAGAALEGVGESMRVPSGWRLLAVCGALGGWEVTKNYTDWRDPVAGCAGALLSAGLRRLVR